MCFIKGFSPDFLHPGNNFFGIKLQHAVNQLHRRVAGNEVNVLQKQLNQLDRDDLLGKNQLLTAERDNMEPRVKAD